jgi:hypothetical protein
MEQPAGRRLVEAGSFTGAASHACFPCRARGDILLRRVRCQDRRPAARIAFGHGPLFAFPRPHGAGLQEGSMADVSWLLFIVASLVVIATPGQDMMLVMSRAIEQGYAHGERNP